MSAIIASDELILVSIPKERELEIYSTPGGLDPYIAIVREKIADFVPDLSTVKSRKEIGSMAYKVARSRTYLDDEIGKRLAAGAKDLPKKIDAERARARAILQQIQDEVRKPLTDWEDAEKSRIHKHETALAQIEKWSKGATTGLSVLDLYAALKMVTAMEIDATWQEFKDDAEMAQLAATESIRVAIKREEKAQAEREELARLRAESEARAKQDREDAMKREAAEAATREAERKAKAERERVEAQARLIEAQAKAESERRERALKEQAEAAERRVKEAEEAHARQMREIEEAAAQKQHEAEERAENDRRALALIEARKAEEKERREKDVARRAEVELHAANDLVGVIAEKGVNAKAARDIANSIVRAISAMEIRHITINY